MILLKEILEKLERIDYERLIAEGKDPVEVLHYKFKNVPSDVIDAVIKIDPTKKKGYSQWLLSKWNDESNTIVNNLKNGRIAKLFDHYKKHQDIQIKDCPSVAEGLIKFVPEEDSVLVKSSKPTTTLMNNGWIKEVPSELANDFDIVFNQDNWIIAVPNTYEADCKLGENMYWCTAGGRSSYEYGRSYYNRYLADYGGKYFVNFDMTRGESRLGKDYPFTRYQFHFESHQFMDKHDDPIELDDIGMPDSAFEFYENEGYDTNVPESFEERMEHYNERWYGCSYRINDDLHLNISYDNQEYEFTEPNESTDYYLYDYNDDNDPISFEEIPNPHFHEDAIILISDSLCIFKKKYGHDDSILIAVKELNNWRGWDICSFSKYFILPDNVGIFGVDDRDRYCFVSECGSEIFNVKAQNCDNIFLNKYCTQFDVGKRNMMFIEGVSNGRYHSLFAISPDNGDAVVIVRRDIPVNGEYFVINENGLIEGELSKYKVYDDDYYGSEDLSKQWDLEEKLSNGDYVISFENSVGGYDRKIKFNILKPNSKEPLLKDWFDRYKGKTANLYCVYLNNRIGFFKISNGEQIGRWYSSVLGIDAEKDVIGGINGDEKSTANADIINGYDGKVIASFESIVSSKPVNNKIVVADYDGYNTKVFDYVEGKFCFPELGMFAFIDRYDHPYILTCRIGETEEQAIFDLIKEQILARGIKSFSKFNRYDRKHIKLTKTNDKINVFDMKKLSEMFENDVDDISSLNEYTSMVVYVIGDKYYPLNYRTNQIQINPNGIRVPTYVNESDKIFCEGTNYYVIFEPDNEGYKFYCWRKKDNYREYGTTFDKENTPQEVLNMYNLIFGTQESITVNFKKIVNRMNEAMKLSHNDIID